jgi:hypothetical protein
MRPIPVPPPVTTAERFETWKRLEAFRSSFDLTDGLSDAIVLIMVRLVDLMGILRAIFEVGLVRSLSIVLIGI